EHDERADVRKAAAAHTCPIGGQPYLFNVGLVWTLRKVCGAEKLVKTVAGAKPARPRCGAAESAP
ncbi:MAG TPA: hypothetical protein VF225_05775, partial [Gaiellaceae bacterium]